MKKIRFLENSQKGTFSCPVILVFFEWSVPSNTFFLNTTGQGDGIPQDSQQAAQCIIKARDWTL